MSLRWRSRGRSHTARPVGRHPTQRPARDPAAALTFPYDGPPDRAAECLEEGPMRTLITNGTIVTAEGSYVADVLVDGETIAQIGRDLAAAGVTADETIDATGQLRHPGRDRRPYPHGAAVRRDVRQGHVRDRHARGRVRRDDLDRRLRGPGQGPVAARGPRCVARQGRGQRGHRLRLPHDHERRQRSTARRDGRAGRRGRPRLQAVHGLSRASSTATTGRSSGRCSRRPRTAG